MSVLHRVYLLSDRLRQRARRRCWESSQAVGRDGEDAAHRLLQKAGITVVARNWRTRNASAELDLVARDGETLVFVEVKSRTSAEQSLPDRQMDSLKRRKIATAAREYALRAGWDWRMVRFDLVTVVFLPTTQVTHTKDAFRVLDSQWQPH